MPEATILPPRDHNRPPATDAEAIHERLSEQNAALAKRVSDLSAAVTRLPAIANDDTAGKVSDYIKLLVACGKAVETARVQAKEPYLSAGRAVDSWFGGLAGALNDLKRMAQQPLTKYLTDKEAARRREAEAAARAAQEEADRKAREAAQLEQANQAGAADVALEAANAKALEAHALAEQAQAKPAELVRTRGDYGATATLRETIVGEVLDRATLDLDALRPFLPADALQKALNAWLRANKPAPGAPLPQLRGARIFTSKTAAVS